MKSKPKEFGLGSMIEHPIRFIDEIEELIEKEIKPFGKDGAHITGINPKHIGKEARIMIKRKETEKHKKK